MERDWLRGAGSARGRKPRQDGAPRRLGAHGAPVRRFPSSPESRHPGPSRCSSASPPIQARHSSVRRQTIAIRSAGDMRARSASRIGSIVPRMARVAALRRRARRSATEAPREPTRQVLAPCTGSSGERSPRFCRVRTGASPAALATTWSSRVPRVALSKDLACRALSSDSCIARHQRFSLPSGGLVSFLGPGTVLILLFRWNLSPED